MGVLTDLSNGRKMFCVFLVMVVMPGMSSADLFDELQPGHWEIISLNTISDVDPCPAKNCSYSAVEGQSAVIDDWNGGAFATKLGSRGGYIVWGGGHNGYYGNEIYTFNLDAQVWERHTEPVSNPVCNHSIGELQDGSPCSAHTYDYVDYHPGSNSFVLLGSASNHEMGGGGAPRVHLFGFDTGNWRQGQDNPGYAGLTGASSAYDPNRDLFWLLPAYDRNFTKFDPNANNGLGEWTLYSRYSIDIDAVSDIDPGRDLFVTLDSRSAHRVVVHDLKNPSALGVTVTTTGDDAMERANKPGFEWDPVTKKFVSWAGGSSVYTLSPPSGDWRSEAWVWTRVEPASSNAVNPGPQNSNGTYSRWQYVPSANAFIIVSSVNEPVYMYKLSTGEALSDATSPSVPTNLQATRVSSSQISLMWEASTDDVGVTGYRLERCQGQSCTDFTQIASLTGIAHDDTGLTAETSYRYRVRAADAAGNLSEYSTIAAVTTETAEDPTNPPPSDAIAPTINITEPATGAYLSGSVKVTGEASDNVGIAGVQFKLDGANLGVEDTSAPYGVTWDTSSAAAGSHTLTAVARDAARNQTTSNGVMVTVVPSGGVLPLGALIHDGPATPEQLSLFLPITGSLPQSATAAVRYKATDSSNWTTGHSLHRIRPEFSATPGFGSVQEGFAWPIIGLVPSTTYDVEVTVSDGATTEVKKASLTTRALPPSAATPNKAIAANSSSAEIQSAFDALNSGDVLEFQNGIYDVDGLQLNRSGSLSKPIIIRGESRTGVVLSDPTGRILHILDASDVIIENLTLQGSGVDSGTNSSSVGIQFWDGAPNQERVTIRNVIMNGVDVAVKAYAELSELLVYDNTFNGNNTWSASLIDTNSTWNDDGINIPGHGNCAFNNTLKGFGDSLAYSHSSGAMPSVGVHFYRNEVRNSGDDLAEVDDAYRNVTFYDNRSHNSMSFISLDPLYGGPFLGARNVAVNVGRSPYKWNDSNTGQFIYNNTVIRTNGAGDHAGWGWVQFNNGAQRSWGYRNNILIYLGSGNLLAFEPSGNEPVDFTHNSWFPNASVWWTNSGGSFASIAAAYSGLSATTPIFSGVSKRHEQDNITVSNPWTTEVMLGDDYRAEVTGTYVPVLSDGTAPKNTGAIIPNVTDSFSGALPDRGAIITGRAIPEYGDRSSAPATPGLIAPKNLRISSP